MENKDRNPIFYKSAEEMDKPISKLIGELRNDLARVRGKLHDIKQSYGFKEYIEDLQGGLTCMISAMYGTQEQFKKIEDKQNENKKMKEATIGQEMKCVNTQPLDGNTVAPPLDTGEMYTLKNITVDSKGNQHFDVGLPSEYNFIRSHETGEELPQGDKIHWCHPSRFEW